MTFKVNGELYWKDCTPSMVFDGQYLTEIYLANVCLVYSCYGKLTKKQAIEKIKEIRSANKGV